MLIINKKSKGFSLPEILIITLVISVILAAMIPVMTMKQSLTNDADMNVHACITKDNGDLNAVSCKGAITACQQNKGNSCESLISYVETSNNSTYVTNSLKILRNSCDNGATKACDFFVNKCVKDYNNCNLSGNNTDYGLEYYLKQSSTSTNKGLLYLMKDAKDYFLKDIMNIIEAFRDVCSAYPSNTTAYEFVNSIYSTNGYARDIIDNTCTEGSDGNSGACARACTNIRDLDSFACQLVMNTCTSSQTDDVNSCIAIRNSVNDDISNNRDPIFKKYTIENCNPNRNDFCSLGRNENWNKNCNQIKTALGSDAVDKVYYIIPEGFSNPIQAQCNMSGFDDYKGVHYDGGWTLILNYLHQGGTDPELNILYNNLPLQGSTTLGTNEKNTQYWGHANSYLMNTLEFSNVRFYCKTSHPSISDDTFNPNNEVNFQTNACNDYFKTGSGYCNLNIRYDYIGLGPKRTDTYTSDTYIMPWYIVARGSHKTLAEGIPTIVNRAEDSNGDYAMTNMPFVYLYRDLGDTTARDGYLQAYNDNLNNNHQDWYWDYADNTYFYTAYYNDFNSSNNYLYHSANYDNPYSYEGGPNNIYRYYQSDQNKQVHAWNIGPVNHNHSTYLWACDDYPNNNYNTFHQIWIK